jgi:hypothetical protein
MPLLLVLPIFFARTVEAVRVEESPVIDGVLNESCWQDNPGFTDFMENWPVLCDPASESTRVVVCYDDKFLYLGCFCYYSEPDQVVAWLVPRESVGDGDDITITIDTYNDDRNAYRFAFNPLGNQRDSHLSNGGRYDDATWNGVWYVETTIEDYGWFAEVAIPFKTLRFKPNGIQEWGLCVSRWLDNKYERVLWSDYTPEDFGQGTMIERFGTVTGIKDVKPGLHMEFLPHVTQTMRMDGPDLFDTLSFVPLQNGVIGMDFKWSLATNLTLDVTGFPDFGQIEADPERINLSRYEIYFDERRPFFTEGADLFSFPYFNMVYTRRIGSRLADGTEVPIYGGGKLTGKIKGTEIGVISALTGKTPYYDWYGNPQEEPVCLYSVGRVSQDIFSRSKVGVIFTSRDHFEPQPAGARALGSDIRLRLSDDWGVVASGAHTFYSDTSRSGGPMGAVSVYKTGKLGLGADVFYTDSLADINAVGYIGQPGRFSSSVDVEYRDSWNQGPIEYLSAGVYPHISKNLEDSLYSYSAYSQVSVTFPNNWTAWVDGAMGYDYFYEDDVRRVTASGGPGFSSNSAKRFYGGVDFSYWDQYVYQNFTPQYFGHVIAANPNFGLRIAKNLLLTGYADFRRTFYENWRPDTTVFASWMWTAGEGLRYTATRKLSFRLNAQQNTDAERYSQQLLATWERAPWSYVYIASSVNLAGDPATENPFDVEISDVALYGKVVYLFRI